MPFYDYYVEFNPDKKNKSWMDKVITDFRQNAYKPLYSRTKAKENRAIMNSDYDLEKLKKMFKNPKKMEEDGFDFITIKVIEKLKNILTAEKLKAEIKAYVDAQDPSMDLLKKEDVNLLKNKSLIEKSVNSLKRQIGLPPEKIGNDDFNGNYNQFEQLGFDSEKENDVNTFMDIFYQLDLEADLQKIINHTFNVNQIEDYTTNFLEDILATKTIVAQHFVNKLTGQINIRRIAPEDVWVIKGERKTNQKGDIAVGYYESITVQEFLKRVGDNFDFMTEFLFLLNGYNSFNNGNITGIILPGDNNVVLGERHNPVDYNTFMNYKIQLGYIEFKSINAESYKHFVNKVGNDKVYPLLETDKGNKPYNKVEFFKERTYKCSYITTNSTTQYIFNEGLLYHQETEGNEDEISNFSIKYMQLEGKTVAEVASVWIDLIQEAFTKFRYLVRKSKADGVSYNMDSLKAIAKDFLGRNGDPTSLVEAWNLMEDSTNSLHATIVKEGQMLQGEIDKPIKRDFDSKLSSFKMIIDWGADNIMKDLGITELRAGEGTKTNDVYKLQKQSLENSSNATYYMDNMFDYIYKNLGTSIIGVAYDIIKFKTSLPYIYLKNIIGEDGCERISKVSKIAAHRADIFVSSFANIQDRIRVLQDTAIAHQNGTIDYATKVIIDNINDHRKAQLYLVRKEQEAIKRKQEEQAQQQQNAMALQKQKTADEIAIINARGEWSVKSSQIQTQGFIEVARINAQSKENQQTQKAESVKEEYTLKDQLEQQKAFGV